MALAASDGVHVVGLPFDGVVVAAVRVRHRERKAAQVVATLPQQVQTGGHAALLQVVLRLLPGDAAVEEGQRVDLVGHVAVRLVGPPRQQSPFEMCLLTQGKQLMTSLMLIIKLFTQFFNVAA